jgi:hypothetical protein
MNRDIIVKKLEKLKGTRRWGDVAYDLQISPGQLSSILSGRKQPGPAVLRRLGLKKVVDYRKVKA